MYLQRSNIYNKDVEAVQNMLNAALSLDSYRGKWLIIKVDGYYGPKTEKAVRAFQSNHNPRIDERGVGDTTYNALKQTGPFFSAAPPRYFISAAPSPIMKAADPKLNTTPAKKPELMPYIKAVADKFMDVLSGVDKLIKGEIEYAIKLGKCEPNALVGHFRASSVRLDPSIKRLQELFKKNLNGQEIIARNDTLANRQVYQAKTPIERINIKKAQQAHSFGLTTVRVTSKQAKDLSMRYVNELRRFDFVTRISNQLKRMGITGEIKISQLKSVKVKSGGVFIVWKIKDILWDLFQFNQWGEAKWQEDLLNDCYEFFDQLIIGAISMVIAEAVVALAALAIGATVSGGVIAVIVVVVAIIIGLIIGFLIHAFCGEDFSFSKYVWEGSTTKLFESLSGVKLQ